MFQVVTSKLVSPDLPNIELVTRKRSGPSGTDCPIDPGSDLAGKPLRIPYHDSNYTHYTHYILYQSTHPSLSPYVPYGNVGGSDVILLETL